MVKTFYNIPIEAAHLAKNDWAELGANVDVAKKGALLHDIGNSY
jgi:putative nucleotidyltransferase with HDIG domain